MGKANYLVNYLYNLLVNYAAKLRKLHTLSITAKI